MIARKLDQLECMRGIAALVVVGWHLRLGFSMRAPYQSDQGTIMETLLDAALNPEAAVVFFFVLSGFVLTLGYFRSGDLRVLSRGMLKRWPRLAGASTVTVLASWALFASGSYHHGAAAAITHSRWLSEFASAGLPTSFVPSWVDAMREGLFSTFYKGEFHYDSSLWTMRPELIGSLLSFGMAPIALATRKPLVACGMLMVAGIMLFQTNQYVPSFLAGVMLARFAYGEVPPLGSAATIGIVISGLTLLTFAGPVRQFSFLAGMIEEHSRLRYLAWDAGSVLLILAGIGSAVVARSLSGTWARWLGRLSFPIYLVHVPVLCSVGAYVYVRVFEMAGAQAALPAAVISTLLGTVAAAIPLSRLDRWWVRKLNIAAEHLVDGSRTTEETSSRSFAAAFSSRK